MQVSPVGSPQIGDIAFPGADRNAGARTLGPDDFMKLLSTQLAAQDPLNPMKDTEFIAQMASFTSLEQMRGLATAFNDFASRQDFMGAQNLLGRVVTVTDAEKGPITGSVASVILRDGNPAVVIDGTPYPVELITAVGTSATPGAVAPGTPAPTTPPQT